jgi:hypothetical protein
VGAVMDWLRPIAEPVARRAEFSRWISARNASDPDQSEDWCAACAHAEVNRLNASNPDHQYFVDGGWGSSTDCPAYCCKCGTTLDDELTEYAIMNEVDHYSGCTVSLRGKHGAYRAFRFMQAFGAAAFDQNNPDMWRLFRRVERLFKRKTTPTPPRDKES